MSGHNKYIMMGVSSLLLPLAKMVIQKLIGAPNEGTELLENDFKDETVRMLTNRLLSLTGDRSRNR